MEPDTRFIIIDDSKEDCFLIVKRLKSIPGNFAIKSFLNAQEGFDYVKNDFEKGKSKKNIIILDIYMPIMDGFEFVEEFEKLPIATQDSYTICALTSSINNNYIDRISRYNSVKYYLEKPIKTEMLISLMEG